MKESLLRAAKPISVCFGNVPKQINRGMTVLCARLLERYGIEVPFRRCGGAFSVPRLLQRGQLLLVKAALVCVLPYVPFHGDLRQVHHRRYNHRCLLQYLFHDPFRGVPSFVSRLNFVLLSDTRSPPYQSRM